MKIQTLSQDAAKMLLKKPRIYVLGSSHFMHEMVAAKNELCELGYDGCIHPHYEAHVRGELKEIRDRWASGERAAIKREYNYLKEHYGHILEADAILFINAVKNGKENYIGGNVLIEMGQAYVHDKPMFLKYDMPHDSPYIDEIASMDPICLKGTLEDIKKYI
jgi:hypothetical protein